MFHLHFVTCTSKKLMRLLELLEASRCLLHRDTKETLIVGESRRLNSFINKLHNEKSWLSALGCRSLTCCLINTSLNCAVNFVCSTSAMIHYLIIEGRDGDGFIMFVSRNLPASFSHGCEDQIIFHEQPNITSLVLLPRRAAPLEISAGKQLMVKWVISPFVIEKKKSWLFCISVIFKLRQITVKQEVQH